MRLKMTPGDVLAVDMPGGNEIQIEAYTDRVTAQVGPQVIFAANHNELRLEPWERTVPPMLAAERVPEGPNIARELHKGEANELMKKISTAITGTAWWAERNGWPIHYVDADGSRVYKKPIEHDTDWTLCVRIYHNGQISVGIEGIRTKN